LPICCRRTSRSAFSARQRCNSIDTFAEIGQRLKAYRRGSGLTSEEIAERLSISRAAVYRIEAGEIVKIDTLTRLAEVLGTSLASLLGVGTEYYSSATAYFERMRQLEDRSDQVVAHFGPASYLLMTPAYTGHLRRMLVETLPARTPPHGRAVREIDEIIDILTERRAAYQQRRFGIVSFISVAELERFLEFGLIGTLDVSRADRKRWREAARIEVEELVRILSNESMGVQIGVVEGSMPNFTFQLYRSLDETSLSLSPFRLGEQPNIRLGIASVTSATEPVALYEQLAKRLWDDSLKGVRGAKRLRELIARSKRAA
jgi:transcriptional regulator with XRE-family HTH domain